MHTSNENHIAHLALEKEELLRKLGLLEGKSEELACLQAQRLQEDIELQQYKYSCTSLEEQLKGLRIKQTVDEET